MRTKNTIINVITSILLQFIIVLYGFIVPKIIIRCYGSNINGLITSITQFLGYISLLQAGIGPVVKSLLYEPIANKDNEEISSILRASEKFFKKIAFIFVFYIIILTFVYPIFINTNMDFIFTSSLIIIISISTFFEYYFGITYSLFLQASQKTYVITYIQIFTYILSVIFIFILTKLNLSIHILKLITGFIFLLRPILQNVYVKKKFNINLKVANDKCKIKNKFEGLIQHIAFTIHQSTDVTLITFFRSLEEVSVYGVYKMITNGIELLIYAISNGISASFGDMIAKKELNNLNEKFNIFETLYIFALAILYSCTIIMIVPFVKVYTINITDADYINYGFGLMFSIGSLFYCFRAPYNELLKSAGMFKETRVFSILEAIINIVISILLVENYGLIGIATGTAVAMLIRMFDLIYKSNKLILKRNWSITVRKLLIMVVDLIIIILICNNIKLFENISFSYWVINSIIVLIISFIITTMIFLLMYLNDFKKIFKLIKAIFVRRKHEN